MDDFFYEGWTEDWQNGYDMTDEEYEASHEPYDPSEDNEY